MKKLKLLWVEDDPIFADSVHTRIRREVQDLGYELDTPEQLPDGNYLWETVRDWKPDIIMMDHNLDNVRLNGANLIVTVRFHDNETPIIFYSAEMDSQLIQLVSGENEVYPTTREDVSAELLRLIQNL